MGRLDVLRSLVHGAARGAARRLQRAPLVHELADGLSRVSLRQVQVSDARLTAALAGLTGVREATVSSEPGRVRLAVRFVADPDLSVALLPTTVQFAPRGAKEIGARVEPPNVASHPRLTDAFSVLAGEVAGALWGPLLGRRGRAGHSAFVHRDGALLTIDLRTVPRVRDALQSPLGSAALEVIRPTALRAEPGAIVLDLGFAGM